MPSHLEESDPASSARQAPGDAASPPDVKPHHPPQSPGPQETEDEARPDAPGPASAADEHAAAVRELEDRWRRALADLDNLRKRHARELERERMVERSRTASAFLPVLDNLELALSHADADSGAVVEGVRAVRDQAVGILEQLGYPRHAETGVVFDPAHHEVVSVVDDPDIEPGTVVQVLRPGYGDGDRQLRPAAVTVAKRE